MPPNETPKGESPLKRDLFKLAGGILLGAAAFIAVLPACGGAPKNLSAASELEATPSPSPAAAAIAPLPTATVRPPVSSTAATPIPAGPAPADDKLARGQLIFQKTAGGVGCAFCHNMDAKGNGPAQVNAPDIRAKTEADIRAAVAGGVPMMAMVKLTDEEFEAVAAYLQTLNK